MKRYKKILVPVDGSDHSMMSLENALSMVEAFGAKVTVVYVMEPEGPSILNTPDIPQDFPLEEMFLAKKNYASAILDENRYYAEKKGIEVKTLLKEGNPSSEIIELSKDFDLIIMGTHGKSGLMHLFIGNVAEKVARHSSCPVMLVREKG